MPHTKALENSFEFWSNEDLNNMQGVNLASPIIDNEDYSKW